MYTGLERVLTMSGLGARVGIKRDGDTPPETAYYHQQQD